MKQAFPYLLTGLFVILAFGTSLSMAMQPQIMHPTHLVCKSPSGEVIFEGNTNNGYRVLGNAFRVSGYAWEVGDETYAVTGTTSCLETPLESK